MLFSSYKMNPVFKSCSVLVLVFLVCCIDSALSISLDDELTITYSQKVALDKFREILGPRLPHEYMKEDIYLIRWLRAQNFDLKRTEEMLMQNLKWREETKMDGIHTEDWSDMEAEYPYHIEGLDKQGQPVITGSIGDWDLRRASLTGRIQRVLRYLDKAMDEATFKIREMQKEGKNCEGSTIDEDLSLTYQQKLRLDKFKESVVNKLPHDYMKQDVYLIRWLRAGGFNPEQAEQLLMKNVNWREKNKMDTILNEDWADVEQDYPYTLDSFTKDGRPSDMGQWDLRNAELSGRFERLLRFGDKIMEEIEVLIRRLQSEGKLVTRSVIILDMDGYNLAQHMCSRCISFILRFYQSFEENYPGQVGTIFFINNHPIVNTVLHTVISSFSPQTSKITRLYNRNKDEYSKALLKIISPDQLPVQFGGTKEAS